MRASQTKQQSRKILRRNPLSAQLAKRRSTLLGIGPMSKHCVDTVIELAYEYPAPQMLIASRRQIEAKQFGGGYANNWSTESFAKYVRAHDPEGRVILSRDHGGPWQALHEKAMNEREAMASCKESYRIDIESGFEIIHIDPSVDPTTDEIPLEVVLARLFELYEFVYEVARSCDREIIVEIGTEEQSGQQADINRLKEFLSRVKSFTKKKKLPPPFFVVVQTGTKVKETENVGILGSPYRVRGLLPPEVQIARLVKVCNDFGVQMKEHNTDYLTDDVLAWHPQVGVHAANVAPEFGVAETRHILRLCDELELGQIKKEILKLAYKSHKWEKWLRQASPATKEDKSVMAGHYVFAKPEFVALSKVIAKAGRARGIDFERSIVEYLKHTMRRYLYNFNLM